MTLDKNGIEIQVGDTVYYQLFNPAISRPEIWKVNKVNIQWARGENFISIFPVEADLSTGTHIVIDVPGSSVEVIVCDNPLRFKNRIPI